MDTSGSSSQPLTSFRNEISQSCTRLVSLYLNTVFILTVFLLLCHAVSVISVILHGILVMWHDISIIHHNISVMPLDKSVIHYEILVMCHYISIKHLRYQ